MAKTLLSTRGDAGLYRMDTSLNSIWPAQGQPDFKRAASLVGVGGTLVLLDYKALNASPVSEYFLNICVRPKPADPDLSLVLMLVALAIRLCRWLHESEEQFLIYICGCIRGRSGSCRPPRRPLPGLRRLSADDEIALLALMLVALAL